MIEAWHFVGPTLRDGQAVPPDGEWLEYDGDLALCKRGLHASERLIDALQYAPGSTICRVTLDGDRQRGNDKICARRRRIEWRIDAADILRRFARGEALRVTHLWDAPDVVRLFLKTGNGSIRVAAKAAVRQHLLDAGRLIEAATAKSLSAWYDAVESAEAACSDSIESALGYGAWVAARRSAGAIAWSALRTPEGDGWISAMVAAQSAANDRLTAMVIEERQK